MIINISGKSAKKKFKEILKEFFKTSLKLLKFKEIKNLLKFKEEKKV